MTDVTISFVIRHALWKSTAFDSDMPAQVKDMRFYRVSRAWFTCEICGCQTDTTEADVCGGLQLHHEDEDPTNNESGNIVVVCPFCHGILHFDLMLANRMFPGRLVWAPNIPQGFLTIYTHLRAFCELGCKKLFKRGIMTSGDAVTSGDRLKLELRERLEFFAGHLDNLALRDEDLEVEGLADLMKRNPQGFGKAFGAFVRKASRKERGIVADHLVGLRYLFDWQNDPMAPHMFHHQDKETLGRWAEEWVKTADNLISRFDTHVRRRSLGAFNASGNFSPWYRT